MKDHAVPVFDSGQVSPAELLLRVRRRLSEKPFPKPRQRADPCFDLSKPDGLIDGWYEPEPLDGMAVRWTKRRFDFEAEVREATHLAIEAAVFPESGLAELRVRLRANDVMGAAFRLQTGWNSRITPIPAGVSGRVHFSIDTGASWSPSALGQSDDTRELSIVVRRLALIPFVSLPRLSGRHAAPSAALAERRSFGVEMARKVRRLLLGHETTRQLQAMKDVPELERRLSEAELRFNEAVGILEDRLSQLARVQAEAAADAAEREEEWQEELARKLLHFYAR